MTEAEQAAAWREHVKVEQQRGIFELLNHAQRVFGRDFVALGESLLEDEPGGIPRLVSFTLTVKPKDESNGR